MTSIRRVYKVFTSLIMILCSVLLAMYPENGHFLIIAVLDISLLIYGFRMLIYYFTMARHMVGGIVTLYKSIVVLDFGMFVFTMTNVPQRLTMLYLVGVFAFGGLVDVIRSMDAKKLEAPEWKFQFSFGIVKLALAVMCLFFLGSVRIFTYLYCIGLIHSALSNLVMAFRKTAIVYIE